jgi:succinyldiaminopimelate transaminase
VSARRATWTPPPYPYDRLSELATEAARFEGGLVDLSIGTPCDPAPAAVVEALARSGAERGYPPSVGSAAFRESASRWLARRLAVEVEPSGLAACVGTKELVAGLPAWLRLRSPRRDVVLYPAISYPTYAMGASLAGVQPVPYEHLDDISSTDADRALCLWVNSPANPTGTLTDLAAAVAWGRHHGVLVASDECYVEFTWDGPPHTVLEHGLEGVLAVHSLSKRSNFAGGRAGFFAGDASVVSYLAELRKHAGLMVPGPVQAAAVAAWDDDTHVDAQREVYRSRLERLQAILTMIGVQCELPRGAFYLWAPAPDGDGWSLTRRLACEAGTLVSPGEFYGELGTGFVRVAAVQPDERIELVAQRLSR